MAPILQTEAEYRKGSMGFGWAFNQIATLYADRIVVNKSDGTVVATIMLSDIAGIKRTYYGALKFTMKDGSKGRLDFIVMKYRFFGLIGMLLSGARAKGAQWEDAILKVSAVKKA